MSERNPWRENRGDPSSGYLPSGLEVVQPLVDHSSAHTLNDAARRLQLRCADPAARGDWRGAYSKLLAIDPAAAATPG
jgi:hypothetical protein